MGLLSWCKNRTMLKNRELGVLAYQTAIKMLKEGKINTQTAWEMVLAGLKYSDLSGKGKKDCLNILSDYHQQWRSANPAKQAEIEWRINEFRLCLQDGYSPQKAKELADKLDYDFKLKTDDVFKYLPEAYMLKGIPKEKAETMIRHLTIWGGSLWIDAFQSLINYHRHRYYVMDAPVISDMEYDWLKEQLREVERQTNKRTGRG